MSTPLPLSAAPAHPEAAALPVKASPRSLSGLLPFLRPYRVRIALALVFLVLAAVATLAFPVALRSLIDGGMVKTDKGEQVSEMAGFEICEKPELIGRKVSLTWKEANVLAAECQGNVDCGKSDKVWQIASVKTQ